MGLTRMLISSPFNTQGGPSPIIESSDLFYSLQHRVRMKWHEFKQLKSLHPSVAICRPTKRACLEQFGHSLF